MGAVGSVGVVVDAVVLDDDACFEERVESPAVEEFVAQAAVEALDPGVLPGRARVDELGSGAVEPAPVVDSVRDELGTIEFLTVVKRFRGGHAGVGTGVDLGRSATPLVTRSSLRFALRAFEIDRRAARTSGGIW